MIADDFNKETNFPNSEGFSIPGLGTFTFKEIAFMKSCMPRLDKMNKGKKAIKDMLAIQGQPGNWDHSEYMIGLHNGLVLAGIEFGLTTIDDLKHNNPEEPYGH